MGTVASGSVVPQDATAFGNQRKIDRTQNGVLWAISSINPNANTPWSSYSTDGGQSWTGAGYATSGGVAGERNYVPSSSLFIDLDDYAHVVYTDANNGGVYYTRGTPNAGRTAYTWAAAIIITSTICHSADVVAHRQGTGWVAHVVYTIRQGSAAQGNQGVTTIWMPVAITSSGTITAQTGQAAAVFGAVLGVFDPVPSLDFRHTGDGKTVAASSPDLFFAFSGGSAASGRGIRFRKATFSSGSWSMGTEREIDAARYVDYGTPVTWLAGAFDGTRFMMAGLVQPGLNVILHERDAADTTTTTRVLTTDSTGADWLAFGSMTYDPQGNAYIFGSTASQAAGSRLLAYRRWVRASSTFEARVTIDPTVGVPYISARRGVGTAAGSVLDYVWTDGTASPYTVSSGRTALNVAPGAPSLVAPVSAVKVDRAAAITFQWTFVDADAGDAQSAYRVRYKLTSSGTWTTTSLTQSTSSQYVLAGGTLAAGDYEWQAETTDNAGATSPWSSSGFFTAANGPAAPTITAPAAGATVPAQTTLSWSSPTQDTYEYRRVADSSGTPVMGTVYEGPIAGTTERQRTVTFATNNRTEHLQVRVRYQGIWSAWASVRVVISFTPPAAPGVVVTAVAVADPNTVGATDALRVVITDPTPTGSQPTVVSHDVEMSHDGQLTWHRVATGLPAGPWVWPWPISGVDYKVRVTAFGPSSTSSQTVAG